MEKDEIRTAFKKKFFNGKIIELHSGDLDAIVDLVSTLIEDAKRKQSSDDAEARLQYGNGSGGRHGW